RGGRAGGGRGAGAGRGGGRRGRGRAGRVRRGGRRRGRGARGRRAGGRGAGAAGQDDHGLGRDRDRGAARGALDHGRVRRVIRVLGLRAAGQAEARGGDRVSVRRIGVDQHHVVAAAGERRGVRVDVRRGDRQRAH